MRGCRCTFSTRSWRVVAIAACAAACASPPQHIDPMLSVPVAACPPMVEPRLRFESSFWLNLHNFLVKEAKRRQGIDDAGPGARGNIQADTTGLRALTEPERRLWNDALSYYAAQVVTDSLMGGDSLVAKVNDRLAASPEQS